MAVPSAEQIRSTIEQHVQLWNEGRFVEWLALWPSDIVNESPAGVVRGRQAVSVEGWERAQKDLRLVIKQLAVLGNEAAAVISNRGTYYGNKVDFDSIEIYTFDGDGSLRVRVFYDLESV